MKLSQNGIAVAHHYEKCVLYAYPDPGSMMGDPWTIGWGHTGPEVQRGLTWTKEKADAVFKLDVAKFEKDVLSLVKYPKMTQGQFDALVLFAYNLGSDIDKDDIAEGLGDSTLLRKFNAGDIDGAAREFGKWNKNDGRVMLGLTRRRASERALFEGLSAEEAIKIGANIT